MFKRYECGCVGFVTNAMEPGAKRVTIFKTCDECNAPRWTKRFASPRPLTIARRDTLSDKPSRKLTDEEIEVMFDELSKLVDDGHALRELRIAMRALGVVSP